MMNILMSAAHAQEAAAAAPQASFMSFIPLIVIFFVFYFLTIRPQKKRMDEEKDFLANLKVGEEVYTKSGMLGKVTGLNEKVVTLEVESSAKIKVLKSALAGSAASVLTPAPKSGAVKKA